ncbi:ATP-dependent nuclease [Planococcus halocryophilus]|uniref:ATP-dependent nuclease n=1 Tax=Planococcus halocryophilus TaxID=1215089 RepID=UPI001F0F8807|nr:AAA family ATPase [Planococcus halocryophilus]MCH4828054.1 AAA family ATPase [Planococcus halocryophilus]
MYISKLSVKNYRNFGDGKFSIPLKTFTAIIGENNVGKSNLIDCIGLILSQDITMFKKRFLDTDDINSKTKEKFKKSIVDIIEDDVIDESKVKFPEVKVEIILDELDEDQLAVVGDWFFEQTFTKAKLTYWFKPRAGFKRQEWIENQVSNMKGILSEGKMNKEELYNLVEFPIEQYEYVIFGGNNPTNKCDPYFLKMLKLEVLDALRDAKKELVANGENKLLYRILNKNYESDFVEVQTLLSDLNAKLKENKKLDSIKKELTTYLDRVSLSNPSELNSIDFNFSSPEVNEILKKLSIVYGENPVSIERNGLGKNNLLFISLVLSHLASQTDEKTKLAFRVIGIEEPEAHLHPHLQTHLAKNLSKVNNIEGMADIKKDTQIVITSHSTNITTSIDLNNLVILYRDKEQIKFHYILDGFSDKKAGREHIKYLKKFLDATNSSMFYARRLILVEGISEQILVPLFFEMQYEKTLESVGSNIINVNGVAFKHFLEIIKNGYFIRCGVLTDKDAGKKTEKRAENLIEHYRANNDVISIEVNEDTFEKELIRYNLKGKGRELLVKTFEKLHPIKYKDFKEKWAEQIDVDEYFTNIENDKSDFAFALHEELLKDSKGFIVPNYIVSIFDFIMEEKNEKKTN